MTEQEQIRAIAKLDGKSNLIGTDLDYTIPRYLTSRDAIVNVVEKQETCIKTRMETFLEELQMDWIWLRISPARLCEALLRATGKWKP